MTSDRQRQANRANAARSTGPKSRAGKAASRGNARLHGLATPMGRVAGADAEIRQLAEAIAKDVGRLDLIDLAARVAEAELDLRRIARVRQTEKEVAKRPPPVKAIRSQRLTAAVSI
jgi:hypothetical protein